MEVDSKIVKGQQASLRVQGAIWDSYPTASLPSSRSQCRCLRQVSGHHCFCPSSSPALAWAVGFPEEGLRRTPTTQTV